MTGHTRETIEAPGAASTGSAGEPKSWDELTFEERKALRLQLSALTVLSALNTLARRSGLTLEKFLETEGSNVFQKIGPIPQVKDSLAIIATTFALVDDGGEPDHQALFANFDAIFRYPDGTPPQSVSLVIPQREPLPQAA